MGKAKGVRGGETPTLGKGTKVRDTRESPGAGFLLLRQGGKGAQQGAVTPAIPVPCVVTTQGTHQPCACCRQGGLGTLEPCGAVRRRPWGVRGLPGGVPGPSGFPAVPSWQGAAPAPGHR